MKAEMVRLQHTFILMAWLIIFAGCTVKEDPKLVAERTNLLLAAMPTSVTTIGEAKEKVSESDKVVVEGWLDLNAFASQDDKAVVMVREILLDTDHGGAGHDPSSCPFCKRRMEAAPKAAVVFVDKDNKALPYKVDELLPIEHGDIVVIQGAGKAGDEIDLRISADGIYLLKKQLF